MRWAGRFGSAATIAVAAIALATGARADGDPASDVLFARDVFLPITAAVSQPLAGQLESATRAARAAGHPVRVALIAGRSDLGAIPSLFGHPAEYARFLGTELKFVYHGRLLVVMPQGAALTQGGRLVQDAAVLHVAVRAGADGLARAALAVVGGPAEKPKPAVARTPKPRSAGGSVVLVRHVAEIAPRGVGVGTAAAIAVGGVVGLLLLGALVVSRRRSRLAPFETAAASAPPDPGDPYAYREPW